MLEFDPNNVGAGFTTVMTVPMTYPREQLQNCCDNLEYQVGGTWKGWITKYADIVGAPPGHTRVGWPQPILSDIAFADDGSMVMGFTDRLSHQWGQDNYAPIVGNTTLTDINGGGDILHACFINGKWILEGTAGSCKTNDVLTSSGYLLANDGPSRTGEFYPNDRFVTAAAHYETANGGLVIFPGQNEVITTDYDITGIFEQGVKYFSTTTGATNPGSFAIVPSNNTAYFGKGNGLGDLEITCDIAPIQIGNRVWRDDNSNGLQDPCEPPIAGAVVKLYNAAKTTVLASVTTNAAGEYYFSSTTITAGTSTSSASTSLLTYNTTYGLVITSLGNSTAVAGLSLTNVSPVTPGESGTLNSGLTIANNDAKVDVVGGIPSPCIKLTTGGPGNTNHTYDFGIILAPCAKPVLTAIPSQTVCGTAFSLPLSTSVTSNTVTSVQWYFTDAAGTSFTAISGATSLTFSPTVVQQPAANQTRYYAVIGQNGLSATCSDTVFTNLKLKPTQTITFTAPASATTTVCANTTLNMSVSSNAVAPDSIRIVYFDSPLTTPADAYTASGGITLGTVASTSVTGTKTLTFSNIRLPDNLSGENDTITVYALFGSASGTCQPVAQRTIILRPRPVTSLSADPLVCQGTSATLVASGESGTTYRFLLNGTPIAGAAGATNPYITAAVNTTVTYGVLATLNTCVSDTAGIMLTPVPCTPCLNTTTSLGGVVYRDFNANGINDTEAGFGGVTVTVFRCDATGGSVQVAQVQTDIKGQFSVTGLVATTDYRVEFSNLPVGYEPTGRGIQNGTTVQFTRPGSCSTSLGLNQPLDYCQANPLLSTSCYINGASTNTTAPVDVLISFNYDNSGKTPNPNHLASKNEVGSTWGLAYDRYTKQLFSSTFLKRHTGIKDNDGNGLADLGAIYVTSNLTATPTNAVWVDLAKAPYNQDLGTLPNDAGRGLGLPSAPNADPLTFTEVGKIALGDLDISDDGKNLWTVNINQHRLLKIAINPDGSPGALTSYDLPVPCGGLTNKLYINSGNNTGGFTGGFGGDGFFINGAVVATGRPGVPYSTARQGMSVQYRVAVPNGSYSVILHFGTNIARNQTNTVEATTQALTLPANQTATQTFNVAVTDGTLDVSLSAVTGTATISGIEITALAGATLGREHYAFGTKYYKGALYVGITCNAEFSQDRNDLQSVVYRLPDDGSTTFTPVLTVPLTYTKGQSHNGPCGTQWLPWLVNTKPVNCQDNLAAYPTPILSDIEFDVNGDMIMGFIDRAAHQWGYLNYYPNGTLSEEYASGGDVLRAQYQSPTSFILENNGRVGALTGAPNTNQGPGGGEFYSGEQLSIAHFETSLGGLALLPGRNELALTGMDPININSQGVYYLSNTNGTRADAYQVVNVSTGNRAFFGKAAGLGDLELFCDLAPIQIGNRVWRDDNRNGVQDPCEPPIAGAVVKLYDAAKTTVLASVTTNAAGEYYFSSTTLTAGTSTSSASTSLLTYNTTYGLVISNLGSSSVVTGLTLTDVSPVTPGESGTLNSGLTLINNDAKVDVVGGIPSPCIKLTTGGPGSTNHTYDFGMVKFICSLTATASASSQSICAGQPVTLTAQVAPVGSYTYVWTGPAGVTLTGASTATAIATNVAIGPNTFTVTVSSSPSCSTTATVSVTGIAPPSVTLTSATICAGQPVSLTATGAGAGATYVFSTTGAVGNVLTINPLTTRPYTVTATTSGGCSATASGTVTVNPAPNAGADQVLVCGPLGVTPTTAALVATPVGGVWSNAVGNPTVATFTPNTAATTVGNLVTGAYTFVYTVNGCSDNVVVNVPLCTTFCASFSATVSASSATVTSGQPVTLTANVSPAGAYTYAFAGPGLITPANAATVVASGLSAGVNTFTVTVTGSPGCFTTATVSVTVLTPALAVAVGTPVCNTLTNNYITSGTISLTNAQAGNLTITDNGTPIATIAITTGQTSATFSATGVSGSSPASHSLVATLGTATASTTYATPASCTVCSLSLTVSSLPNGQVGTAYSQTLTTTGGTAPLTFAIAGGGSLPAGLSLNPTTGVISGTPTSATASNFSALVTDGKSCSALVPLTIVIGNVPVCSLTATATPTSCNTATNTYMVTGTVSATNTPANQSLTISVGSEASTVVTLTGNGPVSYTLTGLPSGTATKTVTVLSSATACGTVGVTYAAPASCTAALSLSVATPVCNSATSTYTATGTVSLTNVPAGTLTITDNGVPVGVVSLTVGQTTASFSVSGLSGSNPPVHSVQAQVGTLTVSTTYTTPASCSSKVSITVTDPGTCVATTNRYVTTGIISLTSVVASVLTVTDGINSTTIAIADGQTTATYSLSGLISGTGTHTVTVGGLATATASTTYLAPVSCTVAVAPVTYAVAKTVDQSRVEAGGTVTYTVSLTNTSVTSATNVVITDTFSTSGLTVVGSASATAGTFLASITGGSWTIPSLAGGQVVTLRFRAQVNEEGLAYNVVTAPDGTSASACLTVPVHVCENTAFAVLLSAPASYSTYQWARNGVPILGATSATLSVTAIGEYTVGTVSGGGCPSGICCPFVVVADAAPSLTVVAVAATCSGATPFADAAITLVGSSTNAVSYNITLGSSFTAATPLFATSQSLTALTGSVLLANQPNPATAPGTAYTIRVYSAQGCFRDTVVIIPPAPCQCPPVKCMPFIIRKVVRH